MDLRMGETSCVGEWPRRAAKGPYKEARDVALFWPMCLPFPYGSPVNLPGLSCAKKLPSGSQPGVSGALCSSTAGGSPMRLAGLPYGNGSHFGVQQNLDYTFFKVFQDSLVIESCLPLPTAFCMQRGIDRASSLRGEKINSRSSRRIPSIEHLLFRSARLELTPKSFPRVRLSQVGR